MGHPPQPPRPGSAPEQVAFAPPYERDGAGVITATAVRTHSATRAGDGNGSGRFDAAMSGRRPMGAFVVRGGRVRWHPVVDVTRVITTAEFVVGGVLIARRLAARPSSATAHVTMGPGGWVSMKGGAMAVRPAARGWRRLRHAPAPAEQARGRRPWWARLLSATALRSLVG
ncbi:MAG: hypothetical protein ACXVXV_06290 [Blastococcus sp.]